MNESVVIRKNPNIVHRTIGDETVLVPVLKTNREMSCIYTLNKTAARVWELVNGKTSLAGIKKQISREFDTCAAEIDEELNKLLKDLQEAEAIIVVNKTRG